MDHIIYEKTEDGIAKVWLNRPERGNAFNSKMLHEFVDALDQAKWDPEVKVIVILAKGDCFTIGYDHGDSTAIRAAAGEVLPYEERRMDTNRDEDLWMSIAKLRKPVIVGARGTVISTGIWIMSCADCIVAGSDVEIHNMEYPTGLNVADPFLLLYSKLPQNIAREFAFTGDPLDAKTLHTYGFFNHVVEPDNVETATMKLAHRMTRIAPYYLTFQKTLADAVADMGGFQAMLPWTKESYNVSTTFTTTPEGEAYWQFAREHSPAELMDHFQKLMNDLREEDDFDLGDVE